MASVAPALPRNEAPPAMFFLFIRASNAFQVKKQKMEPAKMFYILKTRASDGENISCDVENKLHRTLEAFLTLITNKEFVLYDLLIVPFKWCSFNFHTASFFPFIFRSQRNQEWHSSPPSLFGYDIAAICFTFLTEQHDSCAPTAGGACHSRGVKYGTM